MFLPSFFTTITWLGSLYFLLPSLVVLSFFLLRAGKPSETLLLGVSFSVTVIAAHVAKLVFRRSRPESTELLVSMPSDWSVPSAHTAQATSFFLVVIIIAARTMPPLWAAICVAVSTLIVFCVGLSRVYLQVHYLSDVVAGFILAVILVVAVYFLLPCLHDCFGD